MKCDTKETANEYKRDPFLHYNAIVSIAVGSVKYFRNMWSPTTLRECKVAMIYNYKRVYSYAYFGTVRQTHFLGGLTQKAQRRTPPPAHYVSLGYSYLHVDGTITKMEEPVEER